MAARRRAERFESAERWLAKAEQWAPRRYEPATWQGALFRTQAYEAEFAEDFPRALELAQRSFERFDYALSRTPMRMRGGLEQEIGRAEMKKMIARLKILIQRG